MPNSLIRKLSNAVELTRDDMAQIEAACANTRTIEARHDLISEGDKPRYVHLVLEGFACRYKMLEDGRRQIVALFVPGDLCDLHVHILGHMDHNIGTLARTRIACLSPAQIEALSINPRIRRGLWWSTLVDEGILRQWLVGMGRRPADKQAAHLFAELLARLQNVGKADDGSFPFPLTQQELADTLGITDVHVGRVLKMLRASGLVQIGGGRIVIGDVARLHGYCDFNPNYLHLRAASGPVIAVEPHVLPGLVLDDSLAGSGALPIPPAGCE